MNETKKTIKAMVKKNHKLKLPFILTLASVLIMSIALFLPYLTAVGDMAEYIEKYPDRIEVESLGLTASDLKNVPLISAGSIVTGVYGEEDGEIANGIVLALVVALAITTMFTFFKNIIAVIFL